MRRLNPRVLYFAPKECWPTTTGARVRNYHLARALEQSNNLSEAAAQYREAIRLAPGVPIPYRGLGFLLERMGDHGGALAALERATDLDPGGTVMDDRARALLVSLRRRGHQGPRTGS